jgi:D-alanyl-D-alanine carboxypeptidase (penicillin-binding protein 5/6)
MIISLKSWVLKWLNNYSMNLFYLAIIAFVFISTSAMSLSKVEKITSLPTIKPTLGAGTYADLPRLIPKYSSFPVVSAQSAMVVDLNSGVTLYEKDPQRGLYPASTTKIVTALVVLDSYELGSVVTVPYYSVVGQRMGLSWGETITVRNLLEGMLIYSANDAAEVFALVHPGGRDEFITLMNQKVKDLGLINTHFTNPAGLDDANQFSTVKDLITVSKVAMNNPIFAEIVGTKEKTVTSSDGVIKHKLVNTNKLLGTIDGVRGVKTGWTEVARENLVTYIERDNKKIMIAVLGSQDRFGETKELIDWIFANYRWNKVNPLSYSP